MRAYSMDLRERVLKACDEGSGTKAVAERFAVSAAWVRRLKQRRRERGQVGPCAQRRGRVPGWERHAEAIRAVVGQQPDATLQEYRERYGLELSRSALSRALIKLGLGRKKVLTRRRAAAGGRASPARGTGSSPPLSPRCAATA